MNFAIHRYRNPFRHDVFRATPSTLSGDNPRSSTTGKALVNGTLKSLKLEDEIRDGMEMSG